MNTLAFFAEKETNEVRRDAGEGTAFWMQPSVTTLSSEADGEMKPIRELAGPIRYRHPDDLKVNVFCICLKKESSSYPH